MVNNNVLAEHQILVKIVMDCKLFGIVLKLFIRLNCNFMQWGHEPCIKVNKVTIVMAACPNPANKHAFHILLLYIL